MTIPSALQTMQRPSLTLHITKKEPYRRGGTRFGGQPDVPPGFVWPVFTGTDDSGESETRPLSFLAQFDCAGLAPYDSGHLLPGTGLLSFFYETGLQPWGFDPHDAGCARVFWFPDAAVLDKAPFPAGLPEEARFPMRNIQVTPALSFPDWDDFLIQYPDVSDDEAFFAARQVLGTPVPDDGSKLLGWPDLLQNSMAAECELVSQGVNMGGDIVDIPRTVYKKAAQTGLDELHPIC
ncbi:MAG: DUF1963 domain-containing protein [Acutalibacteraceae bacterium]